MAVKHSMFCDRYVRLWLVIGDSPSLDKVAAIALNSTHSSTLCSFQYGLYTHGLSMSFDSIAQVVLLKRFRMCSFQRRL